MNKILIIEEITESLRKILSQLDELEHPIAAIKIAEAINALSKKRSENDGDQEI